MTDNDARYGAGIGSRPASACEADCDVVPRHENAVRQVPLLDREIFLAYRLDALSYAEIAAATRLSPAQVERRVAPAMARITGHFHGDRLSRW